MTKRSSPPSRPAWSKSELLDRAIQDLVRRWVGPSLVVMTGACSAVHDPPGAGASPGGREEGGGSVAGAAGGGAGARPSEGGAAGRSDAGGSGDTVTGGAGGTGDTTTGGSRAIGGTGGATAGTGGSAGGAAGSGAIPLADLLEPLANDQIYQGSGFDPMRCDAGGQWDPMPHVVPASEHAYAALYVSFSSAIELSPPTLQSETGTRCVDAFDPSACSLAIDDTTQCEGCRALWVATSDADDVQHWGTRESLLAFLGEIDSPEDALVMVKKDGYELGHGVISPLCGTAAVREVDDGYEVWGHKGDALCSATRFLLHVARDGTVTVVGEALAIELSGACPVAGRRPEGLLAARSSHVPSALGGYLAKCAHLEAAAVHAFDHMLEELRLHGAPERLIAQAERARADEVRHAASVGRLAERFGGVVPEVAVETRPPRSLLAIALENAVEGCVRETWGALVCTYQAAYARDTELAALMHDIAADERRHATLSFELAAWLDARLGEPERAEVAAAYERAIAGLRREVQMPLPVAVQHATGMPDASTALAMLDALDTQLLH